MYFFTVMSSFMPSIWNAPSPMVQTAGASGKANFAVTAYGIAASIVASRPDMSPCMPRRSRMWWPYQSAVVPASQVTVTPSGSRSFTARMTRRGVDAVVVRDLGLAVHLRLPLAHLAGELLLPRGLLLVVQQRHHRLERRTDVAPEVELRRVPQAHLLGLDVDLHPACLTGGGRYSP